MRRCLVSVLDREILCLRSTGVDAGTVKTHAQGFVFYLLCCEEIARLHLRPLPLRRLSRGSQSSRNE